MRRPNPLGPAVLIGLVREFLELVEPHSEADPAALLAQFLVCFGNAVGRGPHYLVESTRHGLNLFVVVVGETSSGRKGTGLDRVRSVFRLANEEWERFRVKSGLASGEGLINAVRDAVTKQGTDRKGNEGDQVLDPGVEDKRLLAVETEFCRVLKVAAREGNTVATTLRAAWDGQDLETMPRHNALRATAPHISLVGHAVQFELGHHLKDVEVLSGTANRLLWIASRKSKDLPFGGALDERDLHLLAKKLRKVLKFAKKTGRIDWSPAARAYWEKAYKLLGHGPSGLLGAATSRAQPQVLRLAVLFALIDKCREIRPHHLAAALEVWRYSYQTASRIFPSDATDDRIANRILKALRDAGEEGLAREAIRRDVLSGNVAAQQIDAALEILQEQGLADFHIRPSRTRSATLWKATAKQDDEVGRDPMVEGLRKLVHKCLQASSDAGNPESSGQGGAVETA